MSAKDDAYRGVVDAVDRIVNRGDEADEVLRAVVSLLHERLPHVAWAGIALVERDELLPGPSSGQRGGSESLAVPIAYEGRTLGELRVQSSEPDAFGDGDRIALERLATLISLHALVAWDTAGEAWNP